MTVGSGGRLRSDDVSAFDIGDSRFLLRAIKL
jgi:hypothetical protein